jgi:hypothetical protein
MKRVLHLPLGITPLSLSFSTSIYFCKFLFCIELFFLYIFRHLIKKLQNILLTSLIFILFRTDNFVNMTTFVVFTFERVYFVVERKHIC